MEISRKSNPDCETSLGFSLWSSDEVTKTFTWQMELLIPWQAALLRTHLQSISSNKEQCHRRTEQEAPATWAG